MAFHRRIERFSPAAAPRALLAALCVGAMGGLFAAREADGQEAQPAPAPAPAGDDDFGVETPKAKPEAAAEAAPASEEKQYLSAIDAHLTFLQALETEKRFPSAATCGECHPDHQHQ